MSTFKWLAPEAIATALSTGLDGLADGSFSAASAAISNETDLYQYLDLELVLAALSPTAGAHCDVFVYYSMDGTNYADAGKALQVASVLFSFQLDTTAATAQRVIRGNLPILPLNFKLALLNKAGAALAGSGNTLKYRRHNEQAA